MKKPTKAQEISLLKGLLAGVAGGLAGSAAKILAEKLIPPRTQGQPAPPALVIDRAQRAAEVVSSPRPPLPTAEEAGAILLFDEDDALFSKRSSVDNAHARYDSPTPPHASQAAQQGIHWGFGTMLGGAYGLAAELTPRVTSWRGVAFGLTVNKLAHGTLLPKMNLVEPVPQQPAQERVSEWVSHAIYGITTDLVRRAVRKRL